MASTLLGDRRWRRQSAQPGARAHRAFLRAGCPWSEWVQVRPSGRKGASSGLLFGAEGLLAAGVDGEPVAEVLADVRLGQLVEEQLAVCYVGLLDWCEGRDDEPVADADVERVAGSPAGCVGIEPGPQPFRLVGAVVAGKGDEVFGLGSPAAHTHV